MSTAAKHPCGQPGCPTLVSQGSKCPVHAHPSQGTPWRSSHQPARIRGRKLQEMRRRLFARQPLCVECTKQGDMTIATIRDHIIPLAEGGRDDETNEQALCQRHSDEKTRQEATRGVARWR